MRHELGLCLVLSPYISCHAMMVGPHWQLSSKVLALEASTGVDP